ncbi:acyl-CoA carboxylase subunit epsilon [Leifsonia sp. ALI-44-B]|uniref:acyl-CoA carboxylase subunit epsilon n=1 Tax=Leifsonia sp. ALI-44-B TaxID=1933776 RepID=UPI0009F90821|nr:acyl-CoA carboxylase subunit epsilon [Leifsonia sp. ALI-44-B]
MSSTPTDTTADAAATTSAASPAFRVVSGAPSDVELAAVTAVLLATLRAREAAAAATPRPVRVTAWQRSQRGLRRPHVPGPGHWRGFTG